MDIKPTNSKWMLTSNGEIVNRCILDYAVTLELVEYATNSCTLIVLENDFTLIQDGIEKVIEIDNLHAIGQIGICLRKEFLAGHVSENGTLELTFSDDLRLVIAWHEQYESWHLMTTQGERLICMPGGEIASWGSID